MAKLKYRPVGLTKENVERLELINSIIEDYASQGLVLSLRQLYYQLVTKNVIPNKQKEYKKLSVLITEGRMAGVVDWDAIEDRLRVPYTPSSWSNAKDIVDSAVNSFAMPRQFGQPVHIEVWIEKDALSGVLSRVTSPYHIPILVNRGYSSTSAMHDSFNRFYHAHKQGQKIRILYLGDHDPSGLDMVKDIEERILEFFFGRHFEQGKRNKRIPYNMFRVYLEQIGLDFEIDQIALTKEQIRKYKPPHNPAKQTDSRYEKYHAEHGAKSWEVDALKPEVLNRIVEKGIAGYLDRDQFERMVKSEEKERNILKSIRKNMDRKKPKRK
jgi:hypothetical protein